MSVINQMLKDLEKRRQGGNDSNVLDGVAWHGSGGAGRKLPLLGLLVVILAAVVAWLVYDRHNNAQQAERDTASVFTPAPRERAAAPPASPLVVKAPVVKQAPVKETPVIEADTQQAAPVVAESKPGPVAPAAAEASPEILSVSPEPVPGTGRRSELLIKGAGFVEPLDVFVTWDEGKQARQLDSQQVHIRDNETLSLFFNPGTQGDNWTVSMVDANGAKSNVYSFKVEPTREFVASTNRKETKAVEPAGFKTARQPSEAARAAELFNSARSELTRGDVIKGEGHLRSALAIKPGLHDARKLLAGLLLRDKRNAEAASLLDEGLALTPSHPDFLLLRARIYTGEANLSAAVGLLESQRPALQQLPDYYALQAALYQRLNRHNDAAALYSEMLKYNPAQPLWQMGLGISLEALGDTTGAREAYQRALQSGLRGDDVVNFVKARLQVL